MIQRIFYPIGQGAFYSERHENFNIVYDCGTAWSNRGKININHMIEKSFSPDDVIDILFISHFDYDHVSKIKVLRNHVKEIKKVIMPLLHDDEKNLLTNIYRVLNFNILTLINNPQEFFGANTEIITVSATEDRETPIDDNQVQINIDEINRDNIESGASLVKSFGTYDWEFIPYNYEYATRNKVLEEELEKVGFDVGKFKSNTKYTLDAIIKDVDISKTKGGKKLKTIYDALSGKINQNSMLLYSGIKPTDWKKVIFSKREYYKESNRDKWKFIPLPLRDRVSCIYTGDTDLNEVQIKNIFRSHWESVGTIQIPHHGALKQFNKDVLDGGHYFCPMSVGRKNGYGHPSSKVIADILGQNSYPIRVTEDLDTCFIEIIKII